MKVLEITTKSAEETKVIATKLAEEVKKQPQLKHAFIIALEGDLGSGKTTFIQGFAKGLKIKENVLSPTFLILKQFSIALKNYRNFYHIDAYRLKNPEELLELGFKEIIKNPENIVVIEWADKIKRILPKSVLWIKFENLGGDKRKIVFNLKFKNQNGK